MSHKSILFGLVLLGSTSACTVHSPMVASSPVLGTFSAEVTFSSQEAEGLQNLFHRVQGLVAHHPNLRVMSNRVEASLYRMETLNAQEVDAYHDILHLTIAVIDVTQSELSRSDALNMNCLRNQIRRLKNDRHNLKWICNTSKTKSHGARVDARNGSGNNEARLPPMAEATIARR